MKRSGGGDDDDGVSAVLFAVVADPIRIEAALFSIEV